MKHTRVDFVSLAHAVRFLSMDAVERARSGHPGLPMGMAEVATVLFSQFLKFDPKVPDWADRDRFVLSAGHGSMLLYALLYLTDFADVHQEALKNFRQLGSITPGHPEFGTTSGVETTTGPLGQGLAQAVGMALAERILHARFGSDLVDHRTYVLVSDGDLMEGVSHEAASFAGHLGLGRLTILWDDNQYSIDGPTSLTVSENTLQRFEAYGWSTTAIDGHDPEAVVQALTMAHKEERPSFIACRTTIGYGAPTLSGSEKCHGNPLGAQEVEATRQALNWPFAPFVVPEGILQAWRTIGRKGAKERALWQQRLDQTESQTRATFERMLKGELPHGWSKALETFKNEVKLKRSQISTRKASQGVLEALGGSIPEFIGGSADLTASTGTKTTMMQLINAHAYNRGYIHYGVREFAMASVMNGLAVHRGIIPYGGTFLVFSDYMRNAIRLSALMGLRVIYVLTHDSIGLGEDGPTHQPIEHLASLRAMPNVMVYRPADAIETAECWSLALEDHKAPSILVLTRQDVPSLDRGAENLCVFGGYVLHESSTGYRDITLIATGSEVHLIEKVRVILEQEGRGVAVVSMPCWERFEQQSEDFQRQVLGETGIRVAVEAASPFGWERYVGRDGLILGIESYGKSAPGEVLLEHFGFTPQAIAQKAREKLAQKRDTSYNLRRSHQI